MYKFDVLTMSYLGTIMTESVIERDTSFNEYGHFTYADNSRDLLFYDHEGGILKKWQHCLSLFTQCIRCFDWIVGVYNQTDKYLSVYDVEREVQVLLDEAYLDVDELRMVDFMDRDSILFVRTGGLQFYLVSFGDSKNIQIEQISLTPGKLDSEIFEEAQLSKARKRYCSQFGCPLVVISQDGYALIIR